MAPKNKKTSLKEVIAQLVPLIGMDAEKALAEFDLIAERIGIAADGLISDEQLARFKKLAGEKFNAYLSREVLDTIRTTGTAELVNLWLTRRVPVRKKRVGASTA